MRVALSLVLAFTGLLAAAEPLNILPEAKTDLKPTPRDATVPYSPLSYPASYALLHDGKSPKPEPIPVMKTRSPAEFLGDRRFFSPEHIGAIAESPDGKLVANGGQRLVTLFDTATGQETARLHPEFSGTRWLRFSPDGTRLYATSQYAQVAVFDVAKKIEIAQLRIEAFTLTPDAKTSAGIEWEEVPDGINGFRKGGDVVRRRAVVRIRATADWKCSAAISLGAFLPKSLAISPDAKLLAIGGADGTVRIIDPFEQKEIATSEKLGDAIDLLTFHPNGRTVVAADRNTPRGSEAPHRAFLWDFNGAKKAAVLEPTVPSDANPEQQRHGKLGGVTGLHFSPDGKRLLTTDWSYQFRLWDTDTAKPLAEFKKLNAGPACAFSADGKRLRIGGGFRPLTLSVTDFKEVAASPAFDDAPKVPFAVFGEIPKYDAGQKRTRDLPGDEWLREGGYDKPPYAGLELVSKGKVLHRFEPDHNVGWDVSPDGKTLVTFGNHVAGRQFDFPIRIHDLATRKEAAALRVYPRPGFHLRLSPDGKRLAVPHIDGLVRVWDIATLKPLLALDPAFHFVDRVTFSKDGTKLVGGHDRDPVLVVWDVTDEKK